MGTETLEPRQNHPQPCASWKNTHIFLELNLNIQVAVGLQKFEMDYLTTV
jgi:hypothetical protein